MQAWNTFVGSALLYLASPSLINSVLKTPYGHLSRTSAAGDLVHVAASSEDSKLSNADELHDDLHDLALYPESVAAGQAQTDDLGILPPNTLTAWCNLAGSGCMISFEVDRTLSLMTIIASSIKFPAPGKYHIGFSLYNGENEPRFIGRASDSDSTIIVLGGGTPTEPPPSVVAHGMCTQWHLTEATNDSRKYEIHVEDTTNHKTTVSWIDDRLHPTGDVITWEIRAYEEGHWLVMDASGNHWGTDKQPTTGKPVTHIYICHILLY
ncbi:hypothetical protein BU15DRAFT_66517 [Melanogaster broomeanus]|nr:hypothetical protein BU15DRAFT_66517 [Melanogaster broomeanus]